MCSHDELRQQNGRHETCDLPQKRPLTIDATQRASGQRLHLERRGAKLGGNAYMGRDESRPYGAPKEPKSLMDTPRGDPSSVGGGASLEHAWNRVGIPVGGLRQFHQCVEQLRDPTGGLVVRAHGMIPKEMSTRVP